MNTGNDRQIELTCDDGGARAVATLYDAAAPGMCDAIWKSLSTPLHSPGLHAMNCGREIILEIPEENQRFDPEAVPAENQTITPLPGELGFLYYPPRSLINNQRPQDADRARAQWVFMVFYGRDARLFTAIGWQPATMFGIITENLEEFARCCERVRSEGMKPFTVRRLDAGS